LVTHHGVIPELVRAAASSRKCRRQYPGSLQMPAPVTIPDAARAPFQDVD
jgi:hypothetical protein